MKNEELLPKQIGSRIKDLRLKRGLTQEKLSEISGVDSKHIQRIESNPKNFPKIDTIQKITDALHITLRDFFSEDFFSNEKKKKKDSFLNANSSFKDRDKILEDKYCYAIYEKFPVNRGHILIILKRNVSSFFETIPEEKYSFLEMIEKVKFFLEKEFNPDGYNIGWNEGKAAGQNISQVHIHVIPRYYGDVKNPEGGIRGVIPEKQKYLK